MGWLLGCGGVVVLAAAAGVVWYVLTSRQIRAWEARIEDEGDFLPCRIVRADESLYEAHDAPGYAEARVVFSPDRDADPDELRDAARRLKKGDIVDAGVSAARVERFYDEYKALRWLHPPLRLPRWLVGDFEAYAAVVPVYWRRLPAGRLTGPEITCRVLLGEGGGVVMPEAGGRRKKGRGPGPGLWLGIGGAAAAAVVVAVVVAVVAGRRGVDRAGDPPVDRPGEPGPKVVGAAEAYRVERRIDTAIPLPTRRPFDLVRGILSLGASADAGVLAATSAASPRKYVLDRAAGRVVAEFDDPDDPLDPIGGGTHRGLPPVVSPDGKLVVFTTAATPRKAVTVRSTATGAVVRTVADAEVHHVHRVAFSPDGGTLYGVVHRRGEVALDGWAVADGRRVCHVPIPENREPSILAPLADGKTVASLTPARHTPQKIHHPQVDFFDAARQRFVRSVVLAPYRGFRHAAFTPDGKGIALLGEYEGGSHSLDVFDLDVPPKQVCAVAIDPELLSVDVGDFRFLPGGRLGVSASRFAAAYDARTGERKAVWEHGGEVGGRKVTQLTFCATGEMLLVLDGDTATVLLARLKE